MKAIALILGMAAACIGIVSGLWQILDRCGGRPLFGCVQNRFFASNLHCVQGARMEPSTETFHLKILAVQENEALHDLTRRAKEEKNWEIAHAILRAVEQGRIKPIAEDARAIVQLYGINFASTPTEVPYLAGKQVCQRMVKVTRGSDGALLLQIDIKGGKHGGEAALVVPRALLLASPDARLCIEPTFRLLNHKDGRQKVYCDSSGPAGLYDSVTRSHQMRTSILIRRRDN